MTTQFTPSNALKLSVMLIAIAAFGASASAQSGRYGSAGVTVFTNPNFGGQSSTFNEDTPNLVRYALNDKISSIEIPNGEAWEVCQDVNYINQCQVLSNSVADLRSIGWNDRISSLRRVDNGGGFRDRRQGGVFAPGRQQNQGLLFYNQPGFRGASTLMTQASSGRGFSANRGSLQLRGGGAWELCDGSGRCATVDRDVSDVSQLGLRGRIASVRPVYDSRYGADRRYYPGVRVR